MPLVPAPDMLAAARADGYALGYFESWDSYSLEAVLAAAEAENAPVIVGFGATMLAGEWLDAGGIDSSARAVAPSSTAAGYRHPSCSTRPTRSSRRSGEWMPDSTS